MDTGHAVRVRRSARKMRVSKFHVVLGGERNGAWDEASSSRKRRNWRITTACSCRSTSPDKVDTHTERWRGTNARRQARSSNECKGTAVKLATALAGETTAVAEDVRVFYDVTEGTVEVLAIVPKNEAEQWLENSGEPDEDSGPQ